MLTQERLKQLLEYDPETGWLVNKVTRRRAIAGERAGCYDGSEGYRVITINYIRYLEHRLIWFYITGTWPEQTDHIDGDRSNNRWKNLREVDKQKNCWNTDYQTGASKLRGVSRRSDRPKWRATIFVGGQHCHLGDFDNAEEAHHAYINAAEACRGEYAYHNRPLRRRA